MISKIKDTLQGKAPFKSQRSPHWSSVRKHHLALHPKCAVCEDTAKLEVHHIKPFHLYPELELEPNNLITLCESKSYGIICHLLIGHNGNYRSINPNVLEDVDIWNKKLKLAKK
jgi:5-methylcytosine-specific restriction protein A